MDFSSLILIEKDKKTGMINGQLGTYNAVDRA
ncbi:DUF6762 family protein [Clostridium tyrobutyricum]